MGTGALLLFIGRLSFLDEDGMGHFVFLNLCAEMTCFLNLSSGSCVSRSVLSSLPTKGMNECL